MVTLLLAAVLAGGVAVAAALAAGGGSGSKPKLPGNAATTASSAFAGAVLDPPQQAPALRLRDQDGRIVDLGDSRGKAVLVTFLYTRCPDVCQIIASNLRTALADLGPRADQVQVIAVSVDPKGDTPKAVADFLRRHGLTGRMEYLLGSADRLGRTWEAWKVGSKRDAGNPEFVAHSALVYGIDAHGMLRTIYSANFKPRDMAHDVPLLAAR